MTTKGSQVGKYQITSKIAEGGMGAIYKAKHPTLNRDVILKRLTLKQNRSITERFKREAQLMIDFRCDHIVQVYDHFKEGSSYYIVMEFVDGVSLGDLIKKNRYLPSEISMLIFREICIALKYAHDKGVIHRDIKPANVLISKEGEVKLTDFGIARSKDFEEEGLTSAGTTLGTPAYMSPEQIADTKNVDKRADIYSMGVMLYEMVVGESPFPGSFTPEAINKIQKGDYILPRKINPKILPVIQKMIKKAMHYKLKKRYKDLHYLIAILTKKLKRYKDQSVINDTIKRYLAGDETATSEKSRITVKSITDGISVQFSSNLTRIILGIVILIGILGFSSYYFYNKGLHYEYFKSEDYGALKLVVKVKKNKNPEDVYIKSSIFRKFRKGYRIIKDPELNFAVNENRKSKKFYYLESQKIYLNASLYKIQVEIENELYQKDFYLNARTLQKEKNDTIEARIIQFNNKSVRRLPLKIYPSLKDINTNNDITKETDIYILHRKRWHKWTDFIQKKDFKDIMTTGKTYRFRFVNERYYNKNLSIYIKPYQTIMTVELDMTPIPGNLIYKTNEKEMAVLLNNSDHYYFGGKNRRYVKIKPPKRKYQKLVLSPGNYFLTIKKSDSITKTVKVEIEPKKSTKAIINYNKDKESIDLKII